jgi:hypothetical protein
LFGGRDWLNVSERALQEQLRARNAKRKSKTELSKHRVDRKILSAHAVKAEELKISFGGDENDGQIQSSQTRLSKDLHNFSSAAVAEVAVFPDEGLDLPANDMKDYNVSDESAMFASICLESPQPQPGLDRFIRG